MNQWQFTYEQLYRFWRKNNMREHIYIYIYIYIYMNTYMLKTYFLAKALSQGAQY